MFHLWNCGQKWVKFESITIAENKLEYVYTEHTCLAQSSRPAGFTNALVSIHFVFAFAVLAGTWGTLVDFCEYTLLIINIIYVNL